MTDRTNNSLTLQGVYFELRIEYATREIAVRGEFDIATAPSLATAVAALQRSAPGDITLDVGAVTFMDLAGLGAIIGARSAQVNRGHELAVVDWSEQARRLAILVGLGDLLEPLDPLASGGADDRAKSSGSVQ